LASTSITSLDAPLDRGEQSVGDGIADDGALAPELLLQYRIEGWVRQWRRALTRDSER
jgi:hypothetical protein